MKTPRVAIVHDWLTGMRGGEKVVEALCELFPDATLFTLVHVPGSVSPTIERLPIVTSFIQRLPLAAKHYRHYLPLFPTAVERFDLSAFDLVLSSSHAVAKGARTKPGTLHICYCHTPMRYIWDLYDEYFGKGRSRWTTRLGMRAFVGSLRRWDLRTAKNPDYYVTNSQNVRERIIRLYKRDAEVIHAPIDASFFQLSPVNGDYFLIVSAFVPYKRIDLAIEAFNETGQRLIIIGDGPEDARLRSMAKPNIQFLGWQPNDQLKKYYAECRAVIFPGAEDFGLVPLEAMASGRPVIAYAKGGALETVFDTPSKRTGILFPEQTVPSLIAALDRFRPGDFSSKELRKHALQFDKQLFKTKMRGYLLEKWDCFVAAHRQQ
jgi:glycosyltransferase involved in cell wall biosynthesis